MRHGGNLLIDQLARLGVERVFLVPGESFLAALDALHDTTSIETIICRHESAAAMMAEATGKLTGRPGVAFVTRGPGAANAMAGLLIAREDETPMLLVVGMPARALYGREAFQGLDAERFFDGAAKATLVVRETTRLPEMVARAFALACSGRPGPVVLAIPEDVLSCPADAAIIEPLANPLGSIPAAQLATLQTLLEEAERPMLLVGGPGWSSDVQAQMEAFALRFDLPVAAAFRRQDAFDNTHRCYVGHAGLAMDGKLAAGLRAADLLIAVGCRLGDVTTLSYGLIKSPEPQQTLVRVHPSGDALAEGPRATLAIMAPLAAFAEALRTIEPRPLPPWSRFRRDLRAAYDASRRPLSTPGAVQLSEIVAHVSDTLPPTLVVTNGAGNYALFVHRYFSYRRFGGGLAPGYGSMGYGLPAAIAASLGRSGAPVVAFAGDGCFQMTGQELATAVQYALPIVVVVADNGMYGTIRMHQERQYPGRVTGTTLVNPDFAALARSYGAAGERVTRTEDFPDLFAQALARRGPTVLHLFVDPQALTPAASHASTGHDPENTAHSLKFNTE
ncbi:MAG: thiamine pyrophosphate-dependent enzyme [Hyphomicrobium sp.]